MASLDPKNLTKLSKDTLLLGQPLVVSVYDSQGELLLEAGSILESAEFKNLLEQVGYVLTKNKTSVANRKLTNSFNFGPLVQPQVIRGKANPFAEFDELSGQLENLFNQLEAGRKFSQGTLQRRVYNLAAAIQGLVAYNPDALLGAVHLSDRYSYQVHHPMQIAILTELILARLKAEQATRLSTLAAALTCNLAMNPYQTRLDQQTTPLTEQQRKLINNHPLLSAQQLELAGVEDELWLEIIAQHHEKPDGTGYPNQLNAKEIRTEAQILSLADVYSAMVTPRVYKPMKSSQHLRELFTRRGSDFNDKLTRLFINELGIFPPGIYVWLANGELAVVIGRTEDIKAPLVASIKKSDGNMYPSPVKRLTDNPEFAISHLCDPKEKVKMNASQLWGFNALKVNTRVDLNAIDPFFRELS